MKSLELKGSRKCCASKTSSKGDHFRKKILIALYLNSVFTGQYSVHYLLTKSHLVEQEVPGWQG